MFLGYFFERFDDLKHAFLGEVVTFGVLAVRKEGEDGGSGVWIETKVRVLKGKGGSEVGVMEESADMEIVGY